MSRASNSIYRALSWTTIAVGLAGAISFARSLILARLLSPDDYGLFGMVGIVIGAVTALTYFNLTGALIGRPLPDDDEGARTMINTVWTADILRRLLITALLMAGAYPSAQFFGDMRVFPILAVTALVPFIDGFNNIGMTLLRRELDFRNVAAQRIAFEAFSTILAVSIALVIRNVWALALGQVLATVLTAAFSYLLHPYRPRFRLDRTSLDRSLSFGMSSFAVGALTFVTTQFDNLVVGRYLGAATLGVYLIAYRLASMPVDVLSDTLGTVLFPAVARYRAQSSELSRRLVNESLAVSVVALGATLLPLALAAGEVVRLLYGSRWDAVAPLLAPMTLVGLFRGCARTISPFLYGMDRPDLDAKAKWLEVTVFIPMTLIAVQRYGAVGGAYAGAASYAIGFLIRTAFLLRLFPLLRRVIVGVFATTGAFLAASFAAGLAITWSGGSSIVAVLVSETALTILMIVRYRHVLMDRLAASLGPNRNSL